MAVPTGHCPRCGVKWGPGIKRIAVILTAREYMGRTRGANGRDQPAWGAYVDQKGAATRTLCGECAEEIMETIRTFFRDVDAKDAARAR